MDLRKRASTMHGEVILGRRLRISVGCRITTPSVRFVAILELRTYCSVEFRSTTSIIVRRASSAMLRKVVLCRKLCVLVCIRIAAPPIHFVAVHARGSRAPCIVKLGPASTTIIFRTRKSFSFVVRPWVLIFCNEAFISVSFR